MLRSMVSLPILLLPLLPPTRPPLISFPISLLIVIVVRHQKVVILLIFYNCPVGYDHLIRSPNLPNSRLPIRRGFHEYPTTDDIVYSPTLWPIIKIMLSIQAQILSMYCLLINIIIIYVIILDYIYPFIARISWFVVGDFDGADKIIIHVGNLVGRMG